MLTPWPGFQACLKAGSCAGRGPVWWGGGGWGSALCFWKSLRSLPLEAANPTVFPGPKPVENQHVLGALLSTVLTFSLSVPSEIFPYLVVVIGLENVLVLTKSVVSTPVDLEVKLRIAQGNVAGGGR